MHFLSIETVLRDEIICCVAVLIFCFILQTFDFTVIQIFPIILLHVTLLITKVARMKFVICDILK